jgi:hypothetical protein
MRLPEVESSMQAPKFEGDINLNLPKPDRRLAMSWSTKTLQPSARIEYVLSRHHPRRKGAELYETKRRQPQLRIASG